MRKTTHRMLLPVLLAASLVAACGRQEAVQPTVETATNEPTETIETAPSPTTEGTEGAEAYYQDLLRRHGSNCLECLEPLTLQVGATPQPDRVAQSPEEKPLNVLIAFDSSGSMAETFGGEPKITAAKAAVIQFVEQLPDTAQVGLLVYGHRGTNRPAGKAASCAGIETVYPLSTLDRSRFEAAVQSFQPTGYTPIAAALQQAGRVLPQNVLPQNSEQQSVVYVVSDGLETCGGDPVAQARSLNTQANVIVNIIGLNVDNPSQRQLQAIAQAGGGEYFSANSPNDLDSIFNQSKSNIEQLIYGVQNRTDQLVNQVATQTTINTVTTCITTNLNIEETRFNIALNSLMPNNPRSAYADEVRSKLEARHSAIQAWSDRLVQSYRNREAIALDQLRQDLEAVTQSYQQAAPTAP